MATSTLTAVGALVLVLCLSGCDTPTQVSYATWKQPLPRAESTATASPVRLDVHFDPGETTLTADNAGAIDAFLAHNQITSGASVAVAVAPPTTADAGVTAGRVRAVSQSLESRGITVESVLAVKNAEPGTVSVLGQDAKVQLPACPGYNAPIQLDTSYQPIMPPGCYNNLDLGLMVANPADLAQGRQLPPGDAEYSALFVQKYRTGSATQPSAPSTTSGVSQ